MRLEKRDKKAMALGQITYDRTTALPYNLITL